MTYGICLVLGALLSEEGRRHFDMRLLSVPFLGCFFFSLFGNTDAFLFKAPKPV